MINIPRKNPPRARNGGRPLPRPPPPPPPKPPGVLYCLRSAAYFEPCTLSPFGPVTFAAS